MPINNVSGKDIKKSINCGLKFKSLAFFIISKFNLQKGKQCWRFGLHCIQTGTI